MANSAELSHWSHTFQELIDEHRKLGHDYAALLARFPDPIPDSAPAVPMQGKDGTVRWVAVEVTEHGPRPLPEPEQARYAEAEARRCSLLAVHQPFARVYWQPDAAGAAHKAANEWRARFGAVMKRLRRLYRLLDRKAQLAPDQEAQLHAFPLLRADGATCGISGADILEAIQIHIEHLTDDRANLEPKADSHSALPDGLGARLRDARLSKGDKLETIAKMLKRSVSTISRIETGELPADKHKSQIEDYIRKPGK